MPPEEKPKKIIAIRRIVVHANCKRGGRRSTEEVWMKAEEWMADRSRGGCRWETRRARSRRRTACPAGAAGSAPRRGAATPPRPAPPPPRRPPSSCTPASTPCPASSSPTPFAVSACARDTEDGVRSYRRWLATPTLLWEWDLHLISSFLRSNNARAPNARLALAFACSVSSQKEWLHVKLILESPPRSRQAFVLFFSYSMLQVARVQLPINLPSDVPVSKYRLQKFRSVWLPLTRTV